MYKNVFTCMLIKYIGVFSQLNRQHWVVDCSPQTLLGYYTSKPFAVKSYIIIVLFLTHDLLDRGISSFKRISDQRKLILFVIYAQLVK